MRLVSYRRDGALRHGYLVNEASVGELGDGDLTALVAEQGGFASWRPPSTPAYPLADVVLTAPLLRPGKLLGVAANYQDHVTEGGGPPLDKRNLVPRLFLMPPTAIVGPGDPIEMPAVSREVDWEAELAVVIGQTAKDLEPARALDVVAGYSVANDVSARSMDYGFPRDTGDKAVWFFDWLAGKWLDGFAPIGPYLVTPDEVSDPQDLGIELRVNGVIRQEASTKQMIFSVAELVAFASRLMTLEPGDVLLTGTPSGVGAATGHYLAEGDEMTISIDGLGELTNRVVSPGALGGSR
ncbi:fumarylacetoacetate hydrolase family protein [Micromonospora sp. DR5-3]|uniref:fumarylacetoacetate hydrolase family protein n=1 Tax=unclassified Micromonospora TaxID=2617518 RepID=UPI0011D56F13|nr:MULTISPECIES: fumarylacetoacetate hydrolase family protein [unclassified Micromonospora]MCW3818911.1 fumarylacetoacetate hydrolase family protein [Micromonospora sp. DR5-3]TYC20935.1 fumarylacetoacetate hydrolase family protein [Micromonospora sp. MP36]